MKLILFKWGQNLPHPQIPQIPGIGISIGLLPIPVWNSISIGIGNLRDLTKNFPVYMMITMLVMHVQFDISFPKNPIIINNLGVFEFENVGIHTEIKLLTRKSVCFSKSLKNCSVHKTWVSVS